MTRRAASSSSTEAWASLLAREGRLQFELRNSKGRIVAKIAACETRRWHSSGVCWVRLEAVLSQACELASCITTNDTGAPLMRTVIEPAEYDAGTLVEVDLGLDLATLQIPWQDLGLEGRLP